jgi:hypothetical protein
MWLRWVLFVDVRLYSFGTKREAGMWGACKVAQRNSSFGKTSEFCWLAQISFDFFLGEEGGKYISQSLIE